MSCVRKSIELSAPMGTPIQEAFTLDGFRCNYCQGNGYFWYEDEYGHPCKHTCPMCEGSGLMKARVTIVWRGE